MNLKRVLGEHMCLPTEAGAHPWRECKNVSCSTLRLVTFNVKYKVPLNKCGFYSKTGSSLVLHNHLQHSTVGSEHTIRGERMYDGQVCVITLLWKIILTVSFDVFCCNINAKDVAQNKRSFFNAQHHIYIDCVCSESYVNQGWAVAKNKSTRGTWVAFTSRRAR